MNVSTVNNLVDITNYFMIVSGHPIHTFDYDLVEGSSLTITENNSSQIETLSNVSCNTDNILLFQTTKVQLLCWNNRWKKNFCFNKRLKIF